MKNFLLLVFAALLVSSFGCAQKEVKKEEPVASTEKTYQWSPTVKPKTQRELRREERRRLKNQTIYYNR